MWRGMQKFVMTMTVAFTGLVLCAGCATQVGIAANPDELFVEVGDTVTLNVVAVMSLGTPSAITTGLTVTSADESIATVTDLVITGVAEGTTTLSITDGVYAAEASVTVVAVGTLPTELIVRPTSISCTPDSADTPLEIFAVLDAGTGEDVTDQVALSSSNNAVALVTADEEVACISAGSATVTGSYLGFGVSIPVTVGASPPVSVQVNPSSFTCEEGEIRLVQVLATFSDGSTDNITLSAGYTSTDTAVAQAAAGQVLCIAEGTATIVAGISGVTDSVTVTVEQFTGDADELVNVRIDPTTINCTAAQSVSVSVIAQYGDGSTVDVSRSNRTAYQSSDTGVALAIPGEVFCLDSGAATIQASFDGLAGQATVNVQ